MKEWVWTITNDFNGPKRLTISWHWIYTVDQDSRTFQVEWEWSFWWEAYKMIGIISMKISDILEWKNHDYLIFWRDTSLKSIRWSIPFSLKSNEIWYLKTSTGLTEDEEKYLRLYKTLSKTRQTEEREQKMKIDQKIDFHIREERERINWLLNNTKGVGWDLELF